MSIESAIRFLDTVTDDETLRRQFEHAQTPADFLSLVQEMGFNFTTQELIQAVKENSAGVETRRHTGVWKWLRQVNWVARDYFGDFDGDADRHTAAPNQRPSGNVPNGNVIDSDVNIQG